MNKPLIIVWICHFSNREIQDILKPGKSINEIAPWITGFIKLFESEQNIELHVISPHEYISGIREFDLRGIHYHFYNSHIPIWGRHWPGFFRTDYWTNFYFNNRKVKKIVDKIKPDLIHLHGAENAYYSSSILKFKNLYPALITIQGFISHTSIKNSQIEKRIKIERNILKTFSNFGYRTKTMGNQIKAFNPHARLHWHHYPITIPPFKETTKKYDIVFFAKVTKDKGIEDLIKACGLIKKDIPNLSVCIIGGASKSYFDYLRVEAGKLNVDENIMWAGFLPTQKDVHTMAASAKVSVLPTYHEIIAGTIIESLFLKIPVVAYDVGSIHEMNEKERIIRLVEKGNIKMLAKEIVTLLNDNVLRQEIAEKGFIRAYEMFDNKKIVPDLKSAYKNIIKNFNNDNI